MPPGTVCCVCKNKKKRKRDVLEEDKEYIAFYRFPKCRIRRKQWLEILSLTEKNFKRNPYDADIRICSRHFSTDSINFTYPIPRLRDDAVPNVDIHFRETLTEIAASETPEKELVSLPEKIKDQIHVNS